MDTRSKIVGPGAAVELARSRRAAGLRVAVAAGYFDPLLAAHAERLEELARDGQVLFLAIEDPPRPLLEARARAELVAGLRVVDCVTLVGSRSSGFIETLGPDAVFLEREADSRRTQELIEHVHRRQKETR